MTTTSKILLVDDTPANLHTLSHALGRDYDLAVATSGVDALEIARETRPDLILLDVMMPGMDGLETLNRLRQSDWGREIPVILLTADDRTATQVSGFNLGADDFIAKPIVIPVVQARVRNRLEQSRLRRELARSNVELEQFAYAVSHDLRQPLRMISNYLQLLERDLATGLSAQQKGFMGFAVDGAQRLDQMISSLLDYSRVGRKGEPKAPLASGVSLDEALAFLRVQIDESKAEVRITGQWPEVTASRDELTRLFQNLISNALKYVAPGARPTITVNSRVEADQWQVEIKDNGIGIDPAQQERLFKVFSRLHTREQYEGTGIGLALCRKIVEHHQGRIEVQSAGAGQGATFRFILPL